ncbi:MAG: hypothetical protein C5B59_19640 [Bacteroidetes bacterium]|nr:MAG: hypothetical protein C5B59_19640 [Bacteroidota bacterium]
MIDIISRFFTNLLERTQGPMHFRFLLQPTMSLIFAIIAAVRDAKKGVSPYLWRMISEGSKRKVIIREGWKDVGKIFILALALDVIYQLVVIFKYHTEEGFYPLESIVVAAALAIIPYILIRGPVNRIVRNFIPKKNTDNQEEKKH